MIPSHPSHISPHHHPSLTEWLGSNLEPSSELFVQEVIHQTPGWLVVTWGYLNRSIPTNYWYQRPTFQVIICDSFLWLVVAQFSVQKECACNILGLVSRFWTVKATFKTFAAPIQSSGRKFTYIRPTYKISPKQKSKFPALNSKQLIQIFCSGE